MIDFDALRHDHRQKSEPRSTPGVTSLASQVAFLAAYRRAGTIKAACDAVGVSRNQHYLWYHNDPEYPEKFKAAHQEACEALENEARRRAEDGWDEPVYQGGKQVGTVRKYSDTLLIFLLKGAMPNKYKERVAQEVSGPDGGPLQTASMALLKQLNLSDDELRTLESVARKAAALPGGNPGGAEAPGGEQDTAVLPE